MFAHPQWMRRYLDGEHGLVWHELRQLGARVREPAYAEEAQAVCDEMARRVRGNIERIVDRLSAEGYRFHDNDEAQRPVEPLAPPSPRAEDYVRWLEERFGGVPMTLSSWVRIVGDVWLVGTHPQWQSSSSADPLVLEVEGTRYPSSDHRAFVEDELEAWADHPLGEPFSLPVAPDHLHKANVSGGDPYGVVLPDTCADAHLVVDVGLPLVSYLRHVFAHGGFPLGTGDAQQWRVTPRLAEGLAQI